jgi:hypothetical protein
VLVVSLVWTVGQVLDAVVFIRLLIESGLGFFLVLGIVHGGHLNLSLFAGFFFADHNLFNTKGILLPTIKHGGLGSKINRRLIIILIHLRYVEGNEFGGRASMMLEQACIIEVIGGVRNLVLCGLKGFRLHLLHVLR